ncbi:MAG TPA: TonB-dependent receptor [Planctomycetaceae bacterium]|nr:TonB-dependent receptor [Planctomycetaceae bacterium]
MAGVRLCSPNRDNAKKVDTISLKKLLSISLCGLFLHVGTLAAQDFEPVRYTIQDDQPTLPPLVVRPSGGNAASSVDPSELFPSLSERIFGSPSEFDGSGGIFRSRTNMMDIPAAAAIRTRDEIAQRQSADMFQALENETGILMQRTSAGQASPFIRGLTGQQVLILVDGVRLNNSVFRRGPNQYFNTVDPGMLDHVEVLRGQGAVLWGSDAIGGAINLVSRGANSHYGTHHGDYAHREFTQYYNTSNASPYSRLNVEGWVGSTGYFAGASYMNARDLDTGYDNFPRQPGTNYQQFGGDIKLNYMIDVDTLLTFSLQHFELEDVPRSDRFPGYPGDRNNSNTAGGARFFDPQQRDLAYVRLQALSPNPYIDLLTVTASYHRQREVQTRGMPTSRYQETDVETIGVNLVAAKELDYFGKVTAGADWYYDDVDSPFGGTASGPIIPDDAYYQRIGIFLSWDVALTDRLDAVAGVRFEHAATAGTPLIANAPVAVDANFQDWIGQIGLVYELRPCMHLVGSISEGFRAPNLDDLMANNPNVLQQGQSVPSLNLSPENSINYEIGIKTDTSQLRTEMFVFWTELNDNMVSVTAAPDTFATVNQNSFLQGVEFSGELLLENNWSIYGNYWYTFGKNLVTDQPLSRIPPMQGVFGFRYRQPRRQLDFYTWMSDRQDRLDPVRDLSDERIPIGGTPGFATLNLRVAQTLGRCEQHRLSLSLENLTDQPYLVHGSGVYGTGITARLGYSWSN